MTLATILALSLFWSGPFSPVRIPAGQSPPQSDSATQSQNSAASPAQPDSTTAKPKTAKPTATKPAKTATAKAHTTPQHLRRKKETATSNCNSTATASAAGAPNPAPSTGSALAPNAQSGGTATKCPPSKIVVRQGGTSDPSIQLAGGAVGDQAAQQRNTANQMLGATEQNLKKIAGQQLNPDQQGMVAQIRQFVEQSKTAVAAGDTERARTLAWKAQLLSEELASPAK